jgi:ATP-dependent Clp protease ATP-binding subunit ClpA
MDRDMGSGLLGKHKGERGAARRWLAREGYDDKMGARPMARMIQEHIKKPLAEMVLFGELANKGGTVHVRLQDGKPVLEGESVLAASEEPA